MKAGGEKVFFAAEDEAIVPVFGSTGASAGKAGGHHLLFRQALRMHHSLTETLIARSQGRRSQVRGLGSRLSSKGRLMQVAQRVRR